MTNQILDDGDQASLREWRLLAGNLLAQNEALALEVQRLAGLCERDALLDILNRRGLARVLRAEIAKVRRTHSCSCFVFIDINEFKEINDHYGHLEGDLMLKRLVRHITGSLRACDHFARIGGDEFGIILPCTTVTNAIDKASRLSFSLEQAAKSWGNGACRLSFSAGVSEIFATSHPDEIIRQADRQMYVQKGKKA